MSSSRRCVPRGHNGGWHLPRACARASPHAGPCPPPQILIYHPAFIKYVFDRWLQGHGRYPSTGILSVIFSLHICDEVDLYGFGADSKGNWHHYWENNPSAGAFRKTGVHDGDFESNVTTILASINKIRIFKGR